MYVIATPLFAAVLLHNRITRLTWAAVALAFAGLAVLTLVGNMVTGWSWFGTNQLGVGLHAYGFNNTLAAGLTVFWLSQLVCIGIGELLESSYYINVLRWQKAQARHSALT